MLFVSCSGTEAEERRVAIGAVPVSITTTDGVVLDARLWARPGNRIAIYLHEFRDDQISWWPYATTQRATEAASLTLDFRGHGESEGDPVDFPGMVLDTQAAIAFVRSEGYREVMLVGAGMGGAVAIVTAAAIPDITAAGLSVPSEFGELTPLEHLTASKDLVDRIWLLASRDDISAANSLVEFQSEGGVSVTRTRIYAGRGHGVAILTDRSGAEARRMLDILLDDFWIEAR